MFIAQWHIVKDSNFLLHESLRGISVMDYPHTITYAIRRRMQIDSYMEHPKDKRPPKSIWDKPSKLKEWFDRAYDRDKQTEFTLHGVDNIET